MSIFRKRMIDALSFNNPDKIPVIYNSSPAGLHVHGEKLLELFRQYPPDNPIVFDSIPKPPSGTVDENGNYHEHKKDDWGTVWEYRLFGIHGHPVSYPFPDWKSSEDYKFPELPSSNSAKFIEHKKQIAIKKNEYLIINGWVSLFEKLCALQFFENVLMDIYDKDTYLLNFLDRLVEYREKEIQYMIEAGADVIMFADDWGSQTAPLVSLENFNELFKPRYEYLIGKVKKAGKKVFFHSCGQLGYIFDVLINLGIDGLWPQTALYNFKKNFSICKDRKLTLYIHPDRQNLIPYGTPEQIRKQIKHYVDMYHVTRGGAIFYVEIENDAPFENVKALIEAINELR